MTREEILRNAEALAETIPDEKVRGLIQHAYIKGAEDNAVEDNIINVEMVTDSKTGEKYPFVSYKNQEEETKVDTEFEKAVYEILAEAVKRQGLDSNFYRESCDKLLKLAKTCISTINSRN